MIKINLKDVSQSLYVYVLFLLLCYNDFITGAIFGAIALSPILIFTPIYAAFDVFCFFKYRKLEYSKVDIIIFSFIVYSVFISLFYITAFMTMNGTDSFQDVSYLFRFTSYLITSSALFITYRHAKYIFINFKKNNIYYGVFFALVTQLFILIVELLTMPNAFSWLHFVYTTPYYGVRLLAYETSVSGFNVPIIFAIAFYYSNNIYKSRISTYICLIFFVLYAIFSTSKGFVFSNLLSVGLFLIVLFFLYKNLNRNMVILFLFALILPVFFIFIYPMFAEKLSSQNQAVTFSTRFLDSISGIYGLFDYPFGHGFGIHQEALLETMTKNSNKLSFLLGSNVDTSDLSRFSYDSRGLDNKSLFSFALNIAGLFGIYLLFQILKFFLSKKFVSYLQLYIFMYVVLSLTFFISFSANYILPVYIAFLEINCLLDVNKRI